MRLFKSEYKDLVDRVSAKGLEPEQISIRKKGGWVKIGIPDRTGEFEFHRKKVTEIIDGRFQDHFLYRIKDHHQIKEVSGWKDVIQAFEGWMDSVS